MKAEAETRLLVIAATQLGLFTLAQAAEAGLTRQMLRTRVAHGAWVRIYPTVYFVAGHPMTEPAKHLAAVLAGGSTARSSHRAAAWLWAMTPHRQKPELTLIGERLRLHDVRVHRTRTALGPPVVRHGVPTTSPAETLLDLGAVKGLHDVQAALDRGIANRIVTPMAALAELNARGKAGVRGTAALRSLLDRAGITGSHHPSVLESKMRRLIQKAGLPQPQCELIVGSNGEYRLDFSWPELLLAVEVDGWMYHSSTAAFHGDKTRKNRLTLEGYSILEYTWIHVTRSPSSVVRELRSAYAARSALFVGR